jgi:hypothetical protein
LSAFESNWCALASVASDGNTSSELAIFGSVFARISFVPLTGGT